MRIAVIYDTVFGNTAQVAAAVARGAASVGAAQLFTVAEAVSRDLGEFDVMIVGSPTRGFNPTPAVSEFVGGLAAGSRRAAAFDTRLDPESINPAPLRWVIEVGGYAADRIAATLGEKGFALVGSKGGFMVEGTEGPLKAGEIERAEAWGRSVATLAVDADQPSR